MLQHKDIKNIDELQAFLSKPQKSVEIILNHLDFFRFSKLAKSFDPLKSRGFSVSSLLQVLICLPFLHVATVHSFLRSGLANLSQCQKDAYYELKNSVTVNWRDFLWKFVGKFVKTVEEKVQSPQQGAVKCLVLDDSDLEKRGKKIEKVSRVWNHVRQSAVLGFKLLTLGYYDGKSFIPVDFSLHRERGRNKKLPFGLKKSELRKQFSKSRPGGSPSRTREKECDQGKIKTAAKMVRRAVRRLQTEYLLMDSWFTCDEMVRLALDCKIHLMGMMKMNKTLYHVDGNALNAKQLLAANTKTKRCRRHRLYYFTRRACFKGNELLLLFCRQGKRGKWHLIVTTDLKISFLRALEIYQMRWTIEVFFKESKQHLNLAGCQSNDFDAQISHITICMSQYILLALKKRMDDYETQGILFDHLAERILETTLWQRIWHLFLLAVIDIAQMFGIDPFEFILQLINHSKMQRLLIAFQQLDPKNEIKTKNVT